MFYTFNQNNSGGSFDHNEANGIGPIVIVEANSADEANDRAETIGLYFDGAGDCECCGYRWSSAYEGGNPAPEMYGRPVLAANAEAEADDLNSFGMKWVKGPEGFVHYLNGDVVPIDYDKQNVLRFV